METQFSIVLAGKISLWMYCTIFCGALCWEHSHIYSEAAHMLTPFPSVIDSEPVPSEHPEVSQTDLSSAHKYSA